MSGLGKNESQTTEKVSTSEKSEQVQTLQDRHPWSAREFQLIRSQMIARRFELLKSILFLFGPNHGTG